MKVVESTTLSLTPPQCNGTEGECQHRAGPLALCWQSQSRPSCLFTVCSMCRSVWSFRRWNLVHGTESISSFPLLRCTPASKLYQRRERTWTMRHTSSETGKERNRRLGLHSDVTDGRSIDSEVGLLTLGRWEIFEELRYITSITYLEITPFSRPFYIVDVHRWRSPSYDRNYGGR